MISENNPEAAADRSLKNLETCQSGEEDFFCHVTHKTWDAILHDIRKAHTIAGDRVRQFTEIFRKAFQLKHKRLSEEERTTLVKMLRKAPLEKHSGINFQRRGWKQETAVEGSNPVAAV